MPKLKLSYFDLDGGRGEAARLALTIGNVPFDDHRIPFPEFGEARQSLPFRRLPVLEVDGVALSQSNAINRYVGKLSGLYPDDALQALFADEVMEAVEDTIVATTQTFGLDGDELVKARQAMIENVHSVYLPMLAERLESRGDWFADGRLTVADLVAFVMVRSLGSGHLDHVPTDTVERLAPALAAHGRRVAAHPGVSAYYAKRA